MSADATPQPIATLSSVTLRYEGTEALRDVSLDLHPGERLCILGPNGSGKSTLASVLAGLLAPDEGDVSLAGHKVCADGAPDYAAYQLARRSIGYVFQNPDDQIVTSIVEEDVAFGPENLMLPSEEIGRRVERELARVALTDYARADPSRLSGGQKQRVAIAGALAMEPQVLILDEPGALLDVRGRRGIMRVMDKLRQEGTTVVHITHFMEEALSADRVVVMNKGAVALEGTPSQVFSQGDLLMELGLEAPFAGRLATALVDKGLAVTWTCDDDKLKDQCRTLLSQGSASADKSTHPAQATTPSPALDTPSPQDAPSPALSADHVFYTYTGKDGRRALDDVSFSLDQGASVSVVGQTGSGKSTLVRLLCALEVPDSGRIQVNGIDTARRRNRRLLHGKIGYVMQHPERQLFAETVLEDVSYGPRNLGLPPKEVQDRSAHALALAGLVGKEDLSPFQLSGGQQRLCAIAGILAMQPDILILDEPTAGLDPRGRQHLEAVLEDIHDHDVTVVRVTHSMNYAAKAEKVIVLSQSHLIMEGRPETVFTLDHERDLHDAGLGLPTALLWAHDLGLSTSPLTLAQLVRDLVQAAGGGGARGL